MEHKHSIPLKEIVFSTIAVIFWAIYLYIVLTSHYLIGVGNAPQKSTDVNGLFGAFGYFTLLISFIPLFLAIIFSLISMLMLFKKIRKRNVVQAPEQTQDYFNLTKPTDTIK